MAEVAIPAASVPGDLRDMLVMDFPARPASPAPAPPGLLAALGGAPREVLRARDHLIVYDTAADVAALNPDLGALAKVDCWAAIVTAPGERYRFRVPLLRAGAGRSGRSGDRLGALHVGAVLGEAPRQDGARSPSALAARRRAPLRPARRPRRHGRTRSRLSRRPD